MSGSTTTKICKGITTKGIRCKNKVSNGEYCRYHINNNNNGTRNSSKTNKGEINTVPGRFPAYLNNPIQQPNTRRPGYIYIYTYKLLYDGIYGNDPQVLKWLKIDNSVLKPGNDNRSVGWNDMTQILCKIGMTTKSNVQSRLNEWETSCLHKVINLSPSSIDTLIHNSAGVSSKDTHSLSKLMKRLSLSPRKKESLEKLHHREVQTYCKDIKLYTYKNGGFYTDGKGSMTLQDIENAIHQLLWKKYGKGIIHCSGCKRTGDAYKKHIEWFVLPIRDLPLILQFIDNFCLSQNRLK